MPKEEGVGIGQNLIVLPRYLDYYISLSRTDGANFAIVCQENGKGN